LLSGNAESAWRALGIVLMGVEKAHAQCVKQVR